MVTEHLLNTDTGETNNISDQLLTDAVSNFITTKPQKSFRLSDKFIESYIHRLPPFGFNGLGALVHMRTYSRIKDDGTNEQWWETVRRVVEGTYNMQKTWIESHALGWDSRKAQKSAQEMYDRIYNIKFLPPGRGLWAMGSPITEERGLYAALNNCAFVSTSSIKGEYSKPFCFLMDASMLGVGVGFDLKGAGTIHIKQPSDKALQYVIPDSREGWVESLRLLIDSYFTGGPSHHFDYSQIREAGVQIKGFGGLSSGPKPLVDLHENVRRVLLKNVGSSITKRSILDIMNMIGVCVVAGNVRRTAEIVLSEEADDYLSFKEYRWDSAKGKFVGKMAERAEYGWTSNNSLYAEVGMDYTKSGNLTALNGEPGYVWMENAQNYKRMNGVVDPVDSKAVGCNPCVEQTLESYELCCLVENFPHRHSSLEDFLVTLKYSYLYAKTVTLGKTHWPETNRVMLRNRRIGSSLSGIVQFIQDRGMEDLRIWSEAGYTKIEDYDKVYSDWFSIPRSIKLTSIKPSGTVSLLAGATPGVHFPESRYYIRRMRLSNKSELVKPLKKAGYHLEPCIGQEESTLVVEVPVDVGEGVRTLEDVTIWEQLSLAAFMQKYWADNQVSCTVTFKKHEAGQIPIALNYFQYQLKGISFLPHDSGAYPQMPYERIDGATYREKVSVLKKLDISNIKEEEAEIEVFCTTDKCELPEQPLN